MKVQTSCFLFISPSPSILLLFETIRNAQETESGFFAVTWTLNDGEVTRLCALELIR